MRNLLGLVLPAAVLVLTVLVDARQAVAKPDYTRRTKKDCSFCHVPPGYNLNEAGKYYLEHKHSLKGFEPPKPKQSSSSARNLAFGRRSIWMVRCPSTGRRSYFPMRAAAANPRVRARKW